LIKIIEKISEVIMMDNISTELKKNSDDQNLNSKQSTGADVRNVNNSMDSELGTLQKKVLRYEE
jgi:hypothetical protein